MRILTKLFGWKYVLVKQNNAAYKTHRLYQLPDGTQYIKTNGYIIFTSQLDEVRPHE